MEFYPQIKSDMEFALKYANPNISKRFLPDEVRKNIRKILNL